MKKRIITIATIVTVLAAAVTLAVWRPWASGASTGTDAPSAQRRRPSVTVRAVEAKLGSVQSWVFAEGTARAVLREYLTFENPGRVTYVKPGPDGGELREGHRVEKNHVLARQDQRQANAKVISAEAAVNEAKTQITVARAQLRQARTDHQLAKTTFSRYERLLEQHSASRQEYDEAQAQMDKSQAAVDRAESQVLAAQAQLNTTEAKLTESKVDLEETELIAPIDGVIAYKNIQTGRYFTPTQIRTDDETAALQSVPMVIIDPARFEITVNVPSYERRRIEPGQTALIAAGEQNILDMARDGQDEKATTRRSDFKQEENSDVAQLPYSPVRGAVFAVNPAISPGGRAIQVKVRADDPANRLEDGMFVTVWIAAQQRTNVVVAPVGAFTYRNNQPYVFVVNRQSDSVVLRRVTLGLQGFGVQQITSGVEAGELLVTDGRFQLSNGAHVRLLDNAGHVAGEANRD